ncbi:hypothetical protein [Gimesia panareensis]|uniref:hypothetical protein n=1 Tax=Gimesia panareensis TaxID=2527978 RepID=UPI001187A5E2|nr:hypothetical protein [Gimesia panareensis]QDU53548.1 hypothetical protein Pan110_59400 [Gimesia panareensis]
MAVPIELDRYGVGKVTYPGIKKIESANYSRSHGITPDICQVVMAPQTLDPDEAGYEPIEPDGYLLFEFDSNTVTQNILGNVGTTSKTTQILLQGCRPDKAAVRKSSTSENWTIPIYDRRWKWKYGSFSGHWNIKKNGVIESRKERTARQLADMCLEAMGEKRYDTEALDDLEKKQGLKYRKKVRPEVHWDRIPPAQALNDLVSPLGYRVCLGWDDRVRICKYGVGELLPTDDLMTAGFDANLPEIPDSTTVLGGISMHEAMWEMEPVGLDLDGDWRPINHLSYAPRDIVFKPDWRLSTPPHFYEIRDKFVEIKFDKKPTDDEYKKRKGQYALAQQTIYRCYRLTYPVNTEEKETLRKRYDELGAELGNLVDDGSRPGDKGYDRLYEKYTAARRELFLKSEPVIPGPRQKNPRTGKLGDYKLQEFEQILPIFETRAELAVDSYTGKLIRKQPEVTGIYYDPVGKYANTISIGEILNSQITFDVLPEQGILKFSEPITRDVKVKIDDETKTLTYPAKLRVKIATPLKSSIGEPARYTYVYETPKKYRTTPAKLPEKLPEGVRKISGGTDTKVIIRNEIVQAYQARYDVRDISGEERTVLLEVVDNSETEELGKQALATIDVEYLKILTENAGSGVYAGLKPMNLDGAIQQVAISRNTTGGMTTTISRNSEVDIYVPTFDERQRNQDLKEMIKAHNETVDTTQKVNTKGE